MRTTFFSLFMKFGGPPKMGGGGGGGGGVCNEYQYYTGIRYYLIKYFTI